MQAVLFDMDGTLVDSEKVWEIGLSELSEHHGRALSARARRAMVGTNMSDSMRILHADLGLPVTRAAMDESVVWLEERVKELFRGGVPWRPGAKELLGALKAAGVPLALVTATHRHLVDVALLTIGAEHFDAVVAGDEVDYTKPHPMPYRTAAAMVGAEARSCVAVEDSPNGITSARAAGCAVLAVPCEVALDPEGVTLVGSLLDVDIDFLRKLVA
ncbi:HAD family hydrolase [Dactylosporangium matsuzakiense]|uniref:Phosphoglycolate phosphatase n=1 Tax=Dactylosporangium matsuzakiense TaxID=53360 RepID=A0A9W6NJC6_9ACTN|nr:phosphoglycolate phosphatase [Dactylosporangium matsuzakiense]